MSADPRIVDLVLRWRERLANGQVANPEELCRACPELLPEFQRALQQLGAVLPLVDTQQESSGSAEPNAEAATASPACLPSNWAIPGSRYQPLRFHARGGLGEVHVGDDVELHRPVALKRIKEDLADTPDNRRRFLREAEITARLQHPGIVPVYGLVQDDQGRPCYAMRFIEGESLRDAVARFHEADRARRDPAERNLALRQLLGRFVAVCKTIAYAHSRGILHLDLKPANIMLGSYDEASASLATGWATRSCNWGTARPPWTATARGWRSASGWPRPTRKTPRPSATAASPMTTSATCSCDWGTARPPWIAIVRGWRCASGWPRPTR
jgi:serine/threonine protein kinase